MEYTELINNFLSNRYNYLIECSKNILKHNNNVTPEELLSELTIHLLTNQEKIEEYININKLEAFSVSWLKIQGKYETSPVNRKHSNRGYEIDEYMVETMGYIDDEIGNDYTDDYYKELSKSYTEEQLKKIQLVEKVIPNLTLSETILFNAYFIDNLSYDKIVRRYTFYREKDGKKIKYKSKKSIYNLMIKLRIKINKLIKV